MSKKKQKENLLELSVEKLQEKILFFKKELLNLRFQKSTGELANISRFSIVRKEIARVKTELTRRKKMEQ